MQDHMSTPGKEIAKFVCGFETFHALMHTYLWSSGTVITLLGFEFGPAWNIAGVIINGLIALWLGTYAWRTPARV